MEVFNDLDIRIHRDIEPAYGYAWHPLFGIETIGHTGNRESPPCGCVWCGSPWVTPKSVFKYCVEMPRGRNDLLRRVLCLFGGMVSDNTIKQGLIGPWQRYGPTLQILVMSTEDNKFAEWVEAKCVRYDCPRVDPTCAYSKCPIRLLELKPERNTGGD
jgi:hypothetical protein